MISQDFTFWNRRHHCRKCGALVCSDHSKNKEILAHIHKTQKQKICDNCFLGKTVIPVVVQSSSAAVSDSPAVKQQPPHPSTSLEPVVTSATPSAAASASAAIPPTPPKPLKKGQSWMASPDASAPVPIAPPPPKKLVSPYVEHVPQLQQQPKATVQPPVPRTAPPPVPSTAPPPIPMGPPPPSAPQPAVAVPPASLPPPTPVAAAPPVVARIRARAAPPPPPAAPPLPGASSVPLPPPVPSAPTVPVTNAAPPVRAAAPPPPPPPAVPGPVPVAPTMVAAEEEGEVFSKYRKMLQMLPEGAVMQKMRNDGFTKEQIEAFMDSKTGVETSVKVSPANTAVSPGPKSVPPPPPPPNVSVPSSVSSRTDNVDVDNVDDAFRKYLKMKEMLPAGAVRQKMVADGFSPGDVDSFISGAVSYLKPPVVGGGGSTVLQSLVSPPALKSVERNKPPPLLKKASLMDEIQSGPKLRSVQKEDTRMKQPTIQGAGGLLGMLANEMSKRRFNMKVEHDDDDDSDSSGFSDSDSESDDGDDD